MIGNRLKEERKRLGLNQEGFASLASVSRRAYAEWEAGNTFPTAQQLGAFASAGADIQYIVTGERRGGGIGEAAVHQAVLDAVELLSLDNKLDAQQLAKAVVKLCGKPATISDPQQGARYEGSMQVFHQAPTGDIAGRDIVNNGKGRKGK
ncbi:XRE family transcriptional regulator [Pandoraea communis]|uniref:XRE family transcriptional regulator n=2 Tax=Pandoraea communis TaxID=2508297 RepID=A0A5E4UDB5_9BURK|nr:XRE family transcriptional regulator [Pandoraea communis]